MFEVPAITGNSHSCIADFFQLLFHQKPWCFENKRFLYPQGFICCHRETTRVATIFQGPGSGTKMSVQS